MMNNPPLPSDSTTENFGEGISRTWLYEKRLAVIASEGNMRREVVDIWAEAVIQTYQQWDSGWPLLVLHDLSHKNQGITPYAMRRTEDTLEALPKSDDFYGRAAIILRDGLVARVGASLVNRLRKRAKNRFEIMIFFRHELALAWLEEMLPPTITRKFP